MPVATPPSSRCVKIALPKPNRRDKLRGVSSPAHRRFPFLAAWLLVLLAVVAAPLRAGAVMTPPVKIASWGPGLSASGRPCDPSTANQDGTRVGGPCGDESASGLPEWLSRDPIEENGGLNLYVYVGNSPISAVDPLGLVWWNPFSWGRPDFAQISGGFPIPTPWTGAFVGPQFTYTSIPDGSGYFTLGAGAALPAQGGVSYTANWICHTGQSKPSEIDNFLRGWGWNVAGGLGLAGQVSGNFSGQVAVGGGAGVRGFGGGVGYTWRLWGPPQ